MPTSRQMTNRRVVLAFPSRIRAADCCDIIAMQTFSVRRGFPLDATCKTACSPARKSGHCAP